MSGNFIEAAGSIYEGVAARREGRRVQREKNQDAQVQKFIGAREADAIREEGRRVEGAAIAAAGASGFAVGGSALDVVGQIVRQREAEALAAKYGAQVRAQGLEREGRAAKRRGGRTFVTSLFKAGASIAAGAKKAADGGAGG